MNLYPVDYSYFIFPILCILPFLKKRKLLLSIYLIIYLVFSKVGADYSGYLMHFNQHIKKVPLKNIHGEILFKLYMKFFVNQGLSYEFFRIFHIALFLIIIMYSLYKISEDYILSLFIIYCGYIIYLISAYRQMVSMSLILLGLLLIKRNKYNKAIFLNILGIGFHTSSIYGVLFFLFFRFKNKIKINKSIIVVMFIISILGRIGFLYSKGIIYNLLNLFGKGNHFLYYANDMKFLPFGLITRLIPFMVILFFFKIKKENYLTNQIFIMFIASNILYYLIPFYAIMGRLCNNGRFLDCLLLPLVINQQQNKINRIFLLIFTIGYYLLILTNQLIKQGGYYPYINVLFQ